VKRCALTYETIPTGEYSQAGIKTLSRSLRQLNAFPYSIQEQKQEALTRAGKLSIAGVQPKLSAVLSIKHACFQLQDKGGTYILKPQTDYESLPENEDLSMKLAQIAGINVPLHGLIYAKDSSRLYFIKRFDRIGHKAKLAVEDFAQLSGHSRDTKYKSSMEQVATVINRFTTFPSIEKEALFKRTLFNYLIGNEDMHLKNFSLITQNGVVKMTPAYDLVNTSLYLETEEIALPIRGKKNKLTRQDFIDYFGQDILGLNPNRTHYITENLKSKIREFESWIEKSFLSENLKKKYIEGITRRSQTLFKA